MQYIVREATPEDAGELARLRWEFRVEDQPAQPRAEFLEKCATWLQVALRSDRWVIAVADTGEGTLCGCMYLQMIDKVPVPGAIQRAWGYVTNSYVASEHRRLGLGRKLLDLLIAAARARALEFLIVWPSAEAVPFYRRAGFCTVAETHGENDDEQPLELILHRST